MIKLIGSDIDGTLVREGSPEISPEYYEVIRELKKVDISFCVCSGRQFQSMQRLFAPVADILYFAAENGTLLRTNDRVLHSWKIEPDLYVPLVEEIRKIEGSKILVSGEEMSWIEEPEDSDFAHLLRDEYRYDLTIVDDLTKVPAELVLKFSVLHPEGIEERSRALRSDPRFTHVDIGASGTLWIDIIPRESGKGECFALLQELMDIKIEETVYFGDNLNDLSAFGEAGVTATVSNARHELWDAADKVEKSFSEMGVLKELKNLLKHKKDYLASLED